MDKVFAYIIVAIAAGYLGYKIYRKYFVKNECKSSTCEGCKEQNCSLRSTLNSQKKQNSGSN